jgi:hypothetical protein
MLLDWIDKLGLLKAKDDKNILKDFPLPVKRVVVSEIVKYMSSKYNSAITILKTPSHVDFMMEMIGNFIFKN